MNLFKPYRNLISPPFLAFFSLQFSKFRPFTYKSVTKKETLKWGNIYKTKYLKLPNGERIGYRDIGGKKKPVLLLLHGFLSCSITMEELIGKLSSKYRCIAPCLRGYGFSSYKTPITSLLDLEIDLRLFL